MTRTRTDERTDVGWREWLALPELEIPAVKAKIDTGARTSALHAWKVEPYTEGGAPWVRFHLHPLQRDTELSLVRRAPVADRRMVSDSGGHRESRYVIESAVRIGAHTRRIEMTLTDRDTMLFRMLLGRQAMRGLRVIPDASFLTAASLSAAEAAARYDHGRLSE
ncbi:MAG: RimK/LysX family protein [Halofilum sp. (in: g-proteobacteria)]|nr:RimK/LysX family protein [Halofilum sp. (in: g-proteobacteria)]